MRPRHGPCYNPKMESSHCLSAIASDRNEQDTLVCGTDAIDLPGRDYPLTGLFNRSGHSSILLIRTDADGELVWTRNLVEGRGVEVGMRLVPTPDGGCLMVGSTD